MKRFDWNLEGFEFAYSKYYYMPHLSNCVDGVDEDGHFHDTLKECGKASCICAFEDEIITYSRLFFENDKVFKTRAENIVNSLGIKKGSSIFVAGAAFGYLMTELANLNMNVWGCDNSPYIQLNVDTEADYPIHNISVLSSTFSQEVIDATGVSYFDYVISEDLLTSYDNDGEESWNIIISNLSSILKPSKPSTNIIHLVETNCSTPFMGMSLDSWKNININNTWVNSQGKTE